MRVGLDNALRFVNTYMQFCVNQKQCNLKAKGDNLTGQRHSVSVVSTVNSYSYTLRVSGGAAVSTTIHVRQLRSVYKMC